MFDIGLPELLVIAVIVMLIFGVGRISKIAGEIGSGIRAFREGLEGPGESPDDNPEADSDQQDASRGPS